MGKPCQCKQCKDFGNKDSRGGYFRISDKEAVVWRKMKISIVLLKQAERFVTGLVEQDDVSLPMREVIPSTERITGGKMIYMRRKAK